MKKMFIQKFPSFSFLMRLFAHFVSKISVYICVDIFFIENWFIYMHNFYCSVFLKTIHIVLKIFLLFYSIHIYILCNPVNLYLYTSLASIIVRGTPRSALSYHYINYKTYKATMLLWCHFLLNGTTLLWYGTTLLWYHIIMVSHYYQCHTSVARCYAIMGPHFYCMAPTIMAYDLKN